MNMHRPIRYRNPMFYGARQTWPQLIRQKLARLLKRQEMNSELTNQTNKARRL